MCLVLAVRRGMRLVGGLGHQGWFGWQARTIPVLVQPLGNRQPDPLPLMTLPLVPPLLLARRRLKVVGKPRRVLLPPPGEKPLLLLAVMLPLLDWRRLVLVSMPLPLPKAVSILLLILLRQYSASPRCLGVLGPRRQRQSGRRLSRLILPEPTGWEASK